MATIRELLKSNSPDVWSIEPDVMVFEALELMAEKDIGALPVVEKGKVVGIFSERDYARKVILKGKASRDTPVRDLMTSPVLSVGLGQTIEDCMTMMTERRIRHLPVLDGEKLVGIVTIGDVVRRIISEQDETIDQLEDFITGGG